MNKKRVLIVDDEKDFLSMAQLNLEDTQNYEVKALSSARDLISHIHDFRPDVIMLDIIMPGIDGLEACKMINNDPMGQAIPVIIVSALEKEQDKLKAYKLGVVDFLVKPAGKDALLASVEKALRFKT